MEEKLTDLEIKKKIEDAKELLKGLLEMSNPESQLEVIVLLRVCDQLDITTSVHCCDCAFDMLREGHRLLMEDVVSDLRPKPSTGN